MDEATKKSIHATLLNATVKIWVDGEFQGTGFFIAPDGHVLTAYHCIGKPPPKQIVVETRFNGKFVAQLDNNKSLPDIHYDIAVLEIFGNYQPAEYLPLGFIDNRHVGDDIVALGCPAGTKPENAQIGVYFGKISRLRPDNRFENDAMKGPGQSGGPVYHYATHRVIGLAAAVYDPAVMVNVGLSVRFEPLFQRWFALANQNTQVAKIWDEGFKLSSSADERIDYVQLLQVTQKALDEAKNDLEYSRANYALLQQKLQVMQQELEEAKKDLDRNQIGNARLQQSLQVTQRELETVKKDLENNRANYVQLQRKMQVTQGELEENNKDLANNCAQLQQKLLMQQKLQVAQAELEKTQKNLKKGQQEQVSGIVLFFNILIIVIIPVTLMLLLRSCG